jgi:tRNA G18 (ribose-2'-O)-methylase SpoU
MEEQKKFRTERKNIEEHIEQLQSERHPISLLLDGLQDMRNIAAMFRIADAAGLTKIYLYQCPPITRHKKLKSWSRSTIQYVPYEELKDLTEVEILKEKYQLVALEWTNKSTLYTAFQPDKELILVIGNEKRGVSLPLLKASENSIHLPMHGVNTSMNVAVATGVAVYSLIEKI